jgi:hypothetical protein
VHVVQVLVEVEVGMLGCNHHEHWATTFRTYLARRIQVVVSGILSNVKIHWDGIYGRTKVGGYTRMVSSQRVLL